MDAVQRERLLEEEKQRKIGDIVAKARAPCLADAETMRDELMKLGLAEAGTVRGVVEQIFDVACSDGATSLTLSELCQIMPAHFEPVEAAPPVVKEKGAGSRGTSEKRIDLRLMVVKKCKEELEKGVVATKAVKAWEEKEAQKELNGDDKRAAEVDKLARQRMLELVRFCGNLYNQGIVSEKVIHGCIDILIKDEDEPRFEDMETLSALLKSIGSKLEGGASKSTKEAKIVAEYFKKIDKMKENAVSQQLASLLGEVLDLKAAGWVAAA